jgi:hypothetical protein
MSADMLESASMFAWPVVALIVLLYYRKVIARALPNSKVTFAVGPFKVETTLETIERSVNESLRGRGVSREQLGWLERLSADGPQPYEHRQDYEILRPLRNAGLIREQPEGWLTKAKTVEVTTLGRLVSEAALRDPK